MKPPRNIPRVPRQAGVLLIECLVYIAVFGILLGGGMAVFYFCWDHTKALTYATNDIAAALRAGERWRADVRAATGEISVATTKTGEVVRIPGTEKEVIYRFESGAVRREIPAAHLSRLLLPKVKTSQMTAAARGSVNAWRWELELTERRKETHLPLLFTFEAAQAKP
jgi:Tfp pilus assembly protein FimT